MSDCCETHDGPHVHLCTRPRSANGRTHDGACRIKSQDHD